MQPEKNRQDRQSFYWLNGYLNRLLFQKLVGRDWSDPVNLFREKR